MRTRPAHSTFPPHPFTLPAPTKLLRELLRRAGLRAFSVKPDRLGESWAVSTIHRTEHGTWSACEASVDIKQLLEAVSDSEARRRLIGELATALAPLARSTS